jgi:hypothetical protein
MMMKKRDIRLLLLGILFGIVISFIIDLIWDWEGNVADFKKGFDDAQNLEIENTE